MKFFPLIIAALWRKPTRTILTVLGVVVAFLLFGLLQGVDSAFSVALEREKLDRLFVDSRFAQPLPLAYKNEIERIPGVTKLTEIAFLDGYYQDPKNEVLVIATNPEIWLGIRPEYSIPKEQIDAMRHTRTGAIITDWLARQDRLKIGDQFTVRTATPAADSNPDWTFTVVGIMTYPDATANLTLFLANIDYYQESRTTDRGTADRYLLRIDDPRHTARVSEQIDNLFATSRVQTRTQSEHEMGQSQIASVGYVRFFTHAIMGAVFFALLILNANTIMESVRERTSELAVLKTIGYSDEAVFLMVLSESTLPCIIASLAGLALAAGLFPLARSYIDYVDTGFLPPTVYLSGVSIAIVTALISALIPAWRAVRLKVVDALTVR